MNRVSQKSHTSGKHDDDDLKSGSSEQSNERPLDGPDSSLSGKNGWVDSTVGMNMSVVSAIVSMRLVFLVRMSMIKHNISFLILSVDR